MRANPRPAPIRWALRGLLALAAVLALVVTCVVFVLTFGRELVWDHYFVPSGRMEPTILTGDHIVVNNTAYWVRSPSRGEVVVFWDPEYTALVGRVVGLPSELVRMGDGRLYINGVAAELEPRDGLFREAVDSTSWIVSLDGAAGRSLDATLLTAQQYLVVGDNRGGTMINIVEDEYFLGRVTHVYWRLGPVWMRVE